MLEKKIEELTKKITQEQQCLSDLTKDIIDKETLCNDNNKQIIELLTKIDELESDYNKAFFNTLMRIDILFKVALVMLSTVIAGATYEFSNNIAMTFLSGLISVCCGTVSYGYFITRPDRTSKILNNSDELTMIVNNIKSTQKELNRYREQNIQLYSELNDLKSNYECKFQYIDELNTLMEMVSIDCEVSENEQIENKPLSRVRRIEDDKN